MPLAHAVDQNAPLLVRSGDRLRDTWLRSEWVLTNGLGGFAMGTVLGTPTRRYHGLLIAAMRPPIQRIMALSAIDETVAVGVGSADERSVHLTPLCFASTRHDIPTSTTLTRFERGLFGVRWIHEIPHDGAIITITKTVRLIGGHNTSAIKYGCQSNGVPVRLTLRPLIRLDDFHTLRTGDDRPNMSVRTTRTGCIVTDRNLGVTLASEHAAFTHDETWYRDLYHTLEDDRGLDAIEDLFSPGEFVWTTIPAAGATSVVRLIASTEGTESASLDQDAAVRDRHLASLTRAAIVHAGGDQLGDEDQSTLAALVRAGDQFVVRRGGLRGDDALDEGPGVSIIAGYPWFADWGRDAMIALPGLLLVPGRHDEARRLLLTYAAHQRRGIIPNRFDDHSGTAQYNTVDASLWYIHAAGALAQAAGAEMVEGPIIEACEAVVAAYRAGTDMTIAMDPADGLIAAGDATTQLTWMDAQRDGITFTPRSGKAIEINALWHAGLRTLAGLRAELGTRNDGSLVELATRVGASLAARFWSERHGCLGDRLELRAGQWQLVEEIRPNQVLAISLPGSPLPVERQRAVLGVIEGRLLTRFGLRTLAPDEPGYRGRFEGPMTQRDAAYHNGTVWPWLIGPYIEALLRVRGTDATVLETARRALAPLLGLLDGPFLGQLPEVFDGDDEPYRPARPRGCIAQAWSVAEVHRALDLVLRASARGAGALS